eukprot:CAMPEP_0203683896 /NCGR_PEP_ID=MMETSP0090-20130426/47757_1 /ASSEMBLY_ACC=CAM_ASM_001088 /TAXON_ID=426623 /ORGANISM="Chaetoceros affinis, Strain CCMP159" /LENGTH=838 /DNA_ID=CAMNT_0050553053 /DNA_START=174 /DNA_END=2687 /DNA_ORIENTATION=+
MRRIVVVLSLLLVLVLVLCPDRNTNTYINTYTYINRNPVGGGIVVSAFTSASFGTTPRTFRVGTSASTRTSTYKYDDDHNQHNPRRIGHTSSSSSSTTSSLAYSSGRVNDVGSDTYNLGLKPVFYKRNKKNDDDDNNDKNETTAFASKKKGKKDKKDKKDKASLDVTNDVNKNMNMTMILQDGNFSLQEKESTKIVDRIVQVLSTPENNRTNVHVENGARTNSTKKASTSTGTNTGTGTDDLSTLASSIMDAFIDVTVTPKQVFTNNNNNNNNSNKSNTTQLGPTQLDSYALDLYSLAASMTKPPKMKRTKSTPISTPMSTPKPQSWKSQSSSSLSSSPLPQQFVLQPTILLASPSTTKSKSMKNTRVITTKMDPNTPLTVADLQQILNDNEYIRRDDLLSNITVTASPLSSSMNTNDLSLVQGMHKSQNRTVSSSSSKGGGDGVSGTTKKKTKSGLAFPQSSILSSKHVRIGTSISSSIFSMLIAISLQPNLWLIGSIVGAVLGNDIAEKTKKLSVMNKGSDGDDDVPPVGGLYGDICLKLGKRIATMYLKFWDFVQGVWFMYRTGQLSYEYYKTYATLDDKFKIQDKMDAWNARFVEGKKNFDQWERENEIGRKVLAGLRTVWMLEENSYKTQKYIIDGREKKRSKYRLVQYAIDVGFWFKKAFAAIWSVVTGGGTSELTEMFRGIKIQIRELNTEIISQRMGAAMAALLAVNIVGALFAVAPYLLGVIAVLSGMIWPNWLGSGYQRIKTIVEDTRARGRGEKKKKKQQININAPKKKIPLIDRSNFHFFIKENGRKQWYRTGQSMFSKFEEEKSNNIFNFNFFNDQNKKEKKKYW